MRNEIDSSVAEIVIIGNPDLSCYSSVKKWFGLSGILIYLLLSGCATSFQVGDHQHDLGLLWLKQNKPNNSYVVDLRNFGIWWSLLPKRIGLNLGYSQSTDFEASDKPERPGPIMVMGKKTSRSYLDKKGYKNRIGLFWIKRERNPVATASTNIGIRLLVGSADGGLNIGYSDQLKLKSRLRDFNKLVCLDYVLNKRMETEATVISIDMIDNSALHHCGIGTL